MGGAGIYPSDFNPTFSPVESSQLLHLQGRRVHKISKYFRSFRMNVTVLLLHMTSSCSMHGRVVVVERTVLLVNLERYSMSWPDSVSFLPCSAVCLRGLSELVEQTGS